MGFPTTIDVGDPIRIRYKGLFDFDGLYNLIAEWLKSRGYWFKETSFKHKVPSALGAEQEMKFTGEKKSTEYVEQDVTISFHLWDITEVEVERNGVKKKFVNGRIQIEITGKIKLDYEETFNKSSFWKKVRSFYYNYIMQPEIFSMADQLYYRLIKLQTSIKDFLDMQTKSNEYSNYLGDEK